MSKKIRVNFWNPVELAFQVGILDRITGIIKNFKGRRFKADKVKFKSFDK